MIERRVTDCLEHIVDFGDVLKNIWEAWLEKID